MIEQVREILSKIGPNGRQRLAEWHSKPNSHRWFVNGFIGTLGEQYRTAAEWIAGELERDKELGKDIADGLTSNPTATIRLFLRSVPDRLSQASNPQNNSATVAQLQTTVHNLEARVTNVEDAVRSTGSPGTENPTTSVILDALGFGSLQDIKSRPQRQRIEDLSKQCNGLAKRQIINRTQGEIQEGRLKPKGG